MSQEFLNWYEGVYSHDDQDASLVAQRDIAWHSWQAALEFKKSNRYKLPRQD